MPNFATVFSVLDYVQNPAQQSFCHTDEILFWCELFNRNDTHIFNHSNDEYEVFQWYHDPLDALVALPIILLLFFPLIWEEEEIRETEGGN